MATVTGYIKTQDDTLLAGKDAAGSATAAQNYAVQRGNHTGTQTADTITDGTTNKAYTAAEKTKLAGVATGATANRTDAATDTLLAAKADLVGGVIPSAQIPSIALTNAVTVASQAAMLALTTTQVQPGDVAVRTDGAGTFILTATDPTVLGNWVRLNAPTDAVTTVNGQSGAVVLAATDVGAAPSSLSATVATNTSNIATNTTAIAAQRLGGTVNAITSNATAVIGVRNTVDATAAPITVTLPTPTAIGQWMIIERLDATTTNAISITGTIRGVAASTATLPAVGAANEGGLWVAESLTSWTPAGSIKPKAWLDAVYDAKGAATAAVTGLAPLASPTFTGTPAVPTATAGTSTTQAASTAFVLANAVNLNDAASQQLGPDGTSLASSWQAFRTTPQRPPSKVITRFPSGHGWTGGTDDLTVTLYTDRTYKKTTDGAGTFFHLTGPTITAVDCSASNIRIAFRVSDPTKVANLGFLVTTSSGNTYNGPLYSYQAASANEWCIATIPRASLTATGSPSWASITQFDLYFSDIGGGAGNTFTLNLGDVDLIPDLNATYPNGVFILEADDGYIGQKTYLAPVVGQRGIPVTYNVIGDRFVGGTPASGMTAADLRTFQDLYGWQISCHAYGSAVHNASPATSAALEQDFQRQKHWLHANGLHTGADHYAECPGSGSPIAAGPTMDAIRKSFRSARVNMGFFETAVVSDPLRIKSLLYSGNTVAQLQTNINSVAGAGGAFIFTVHDVIAGATNGTSNGLAAIAQTNLATVLDYAAGKGMVFRTRADWLDGR